MSTTVKILSELFERVKRPLLASEIKSKLNLPDSQELEIEDPDKKINKITVWNQKGPSYVLLKDVCFFYPKIMLEEYWTREIIFQLRNRRNELPVSAIISNLKHQLHIYFGLINPLGKEYSIITDAGLGESAETRILEFLLQHENFFYVRQKTSVNYQTIIGLKEWLTETSGNDKIKIKSSIISVLRSAPKRTLGVDDIVFGVNRFNIETITKKPYNNNLIKKIIGNSAHRFDFANKWDTWSLIDDLEYLTYYFKEYQKLLKDINFDYAYSGLAAFIFIGNKFPLEEAEEYVKTRPIIYIEQIKDPSFIPNSGINWLPSELKGYLESLLFTADEVNKWGEENLAVSIYFEHFDEVKLLAPKVIEHFSPVFNVDGNPGNLFQYTLKSKLEEYYLRYPDKELPF